MSQSTRESSSGERLSRSQSPMRRSGDRSQSPIERRNVQSQSPVQSTVREGSKSPSRRAGIQNQSSFRTDSAESAAPEAMGISLEDDGSVFENLSAEQSRASSQQSRSDVSFQSYSNESKISSGSGASRRDDLSLSYSVDESMMSRASTYISAASSEDSQQKFAKTSIENLLPPPQQVEKAEEEEPSIIGMKTPLEYVIGGNDDEVSSLGGFSESYGWDGDNSTIATTPTIKRDLSMQHQPTIFEEEEEEEGDDEDCGEEQRFHTSQEQPSASFDWDGDNSTIATTPTIKRDLSMQHQPTIFEEDDEDEEYGEKQRSRTSQEQPSVIEEESAEVDSHGDVSTASESQEDRSKYQGGAYRSTQSTNTSSNNTATVSPLTFVRDDDDEEDVETFDESHLYSRESYEDQASQMNYTVGGTVSTITNDPYFQQVSSEGSKISTEMKSIAEDAESMLEEDLEPEEYNFEEGPTEKSAAHAESLASMDLGDETPQSVYSDSKSQASMYSAAKSLRSVYSDTSSDFLVNRSSSVIDEDAVRHKINHDDMSLSRSESMNYETTDNYSVNSEYNRREEGDRSDSCSVSVNSSRSEMWRQNIASNRSWRSAKSIGQSYRRPFVSGGSVGSRHTSRTSASVMPEVAEVIREGDGSRPMMTRGMSGRAVIHVKMNSTNDGTIEDLCYTTPLVDDSELDNTTMMSTDDERDLHTLSEKSAKMPLFDYYFARYKIVRICYARQCYRMMAVILVIFAIAFAVLISLITHVTELKSGLNSSPNKPGFSLDDLRKPEAFNSAHFSGPVDRHLGNWFREKGDYWTQKNEDVPFLIDIPMAGSFTVVKSWGECLGQTIASNQGKEVENILREESILGVNYVIVDLSMRHGIKHAARLDLIPSGLPDIVISPLFLDIVEILYSNQHKAKFIVTLRDPIQRSLAMFEYTKQENPEVAALAPEEFAQSKYIENNYVTRLLTGKSSGALSRKDVEFCKELLRRKAIIGLYENIEEALKHFELYLGWSPSTSHALNCQAGAIADALNNKPSIELDESSGAYALIRQQNIHDISLYNYAKNVLVPFQREVIKRQKKSRSTDGGSSSM